MTAAAYFFRNKKGFKPLRSAKRQPMEILKTIKQELEKSGMESYFIGKNVEETLARVYFPSIN